MVPSLAFVGGLVVDSWVLKFHVAYPNYDLFCDGVCGLCPHALFLQARSQILLLNYDNYDTLITYFVILYVNLLQFPECVDKISIACLDLHYSVPFNHKKHKSDYDVMPMVLPSINTDNENNIFDGYSDDCGDERKMAGDVANEEETIGPKVTNGVASK